MTDRLLPTGFCWCGCGKEVGIGKFFAQGHDKIAEAAFMAARYEGSVARLLHEHGYGPDNPVTEAAVNAGRWTHCTRPGCTYTGTPESVRRHETKPHAEK